MSQPHPTPATRRLEVDLTPAEMTALYEHLAQWASLENLPLKRKLRAAIALAGGPKDIPADEVMSQALEHAKSTIHRLTSKPAPTPETDDSKSAL